MDANERLEILKTNKNAIRHTLQIYGLYKIIRIIGLLGSALTIMKHSLFPCI